MGKGRSRPRLLRARTRPPGPRSGPEEEGTAHGRWRRLVVFSSLFMSLAAAGPAAQDRSVALVGSCESPASFPVDDEPRVELVLEGRVLGRTGCPPRGGGGREQRGGKAVTDAAGTPARGRRAARSHERAGHGGGARAGTERERGGVAGRDGGTAASAAPARARGFVLAAVAADVRRDRGELRHAGHGIFDDGSGPGSTSEAVSRGRAS
jgi:hypothetical protein